MSAIGTHVDLRKGAGGLPQNLEVSWYIISKRSSFGSNTRCMVVQPTSSGSSNPTSRVLISTPCFCLGLGSLAHASSNRSFRAPTRAAFGVPIVTRGRAIPSHPSTSTDVAVEYSSEGPTHIRDLKCTEVKDDECTNVHVVMKIMHFQERH
jgi:hypothetical protein